MPQRNVSLKTPCRSSSTDCSEDLEHLYHYFAFLKRPVWPMSDVLVLLFHPLKYIYSGNLYRIAPEDIYRSYQIYIYILTMLKMGLYSCGMQPDYENNDNFGQLV